MAVTAAATFEPDLLWAVAQFTNTDRADKYTKARNYYDGNQELAFATKKFESAFGNQFAAFAYNRCSTVVDAIADRLQLLGFDLEGNVQTAAEAGGTADPNADAATDPVKIALETIWNYNRMDKRQGDLHTEVLTTGDGYLIVWPEQDLTTGEFIPRFFVNKAGQVFLKLDEETKRKQFAVKAWRIVGGLKDGFWRVTFYYPDRIEKYITRAKKDALSKKTDDYEPYVPEMENPLAELEPWPIANPFGEVPVFWFANNAPEGEYGRSELRDVIPLQDALNKSCMDLMVAMEYGAFRQRWVTGMGFGTPGADGKVSSPFRTGPGEVWSGPQGANFGDFESSDLTKFIEVQDSYDGKISNVARIPKHWLTVATEPPSGESYKVAEGPFVKKLKDRMIDLGNPHEDAARFALKTMGFVDVLNLSARWAPAELRDEKELADVSAAKAALNVPDEQLWKELGYTEAEIELFKQMKQDAILEAQKAMDAGGLTPFPGGGSAGVPPPQDQGSQGNQQNQKP